MLCATRRVIAETGAFVVSQALSERQTPERRAVTARERRENMTRASCRRAFEQNCHERFGVRHELHDPRGLDLEPSDEV